MRITAETHHRLFSIRARMLCAACIAAVAALAAGPISGASAAPPPTLSITSPTGGSVSNNPSPTFAGNTSDYFEYDFLKFDPITVRIYKGASALGEEVEFVETGPTPFEGSSWSAGPAKSLAAGTYTAVAEQSDEVLPNGLPTDTGKSEPVTFTIDTTPPQVGLTSPGSGSSTTSSSPVISGTAGTATGDVQEVTVQLFAGTTTGSQAALEAVTVQASGGGWSATFGGVSPGTYTVRAEQRDQAGNVGTSAPVTFTVTAPVSQAPTHTPPAASFKWFPSAPVVGEPVSLISSSTDDFSPISLFAWALTGNGPFSSGKSSLTTSFSTPGDHVVRLRVTAADGLSSIATQTIHVGRQSLTLMQPFPIVRIAGVVTPSGVNLSLLTAQAPVGSMVKVTCRGRGCPKASESRVASSSAKKHRPAMVLIAFRRFQRSLGAGTVLEVRISKPARIGKYTRFSIRRGKLPVRLDSCIGPAGIKPIACPSS